MRQRFLYLCLAFSLTFAACTQDPGEPIVSGVVVPTTVPTVSTTTTTKPGIIIVPAILPLAVSTAVYSPTPQKAPEISSESRWDRLRRCEAPDWAGGWAANTGNGYFGGLQFAHSSWTGYGGLEFASRADLASREQQIVVAERILATQGWRAWPACSKKLGYR